MSSTGRARASRLASTVAIEGLQCSANTEASLENMVWSQGHVLCQPDGWKSTNSAIRCVWAITYASPNHLSAHAYFQKWHGFLS